MSSGNAMPEKAGKNCVSIQVSKGRLQLVISHAGQRHYLSLGLEDTPLNRKAAEAKLGQIESDILCGNFDESLAKYSAQSTLTSVDGGIKDPKNSLKDIWQKYKTFKAGQIAETTIKYYYRVADSAFEKVSPSLLYADRAADLVAALQEIYAPETVKRTLKILSACCNWAVQQKLIKKNPFPEFIREIKSGSRNVSCKSFTKEERDAIIQAFESDRFCPKASGFKHSYYTGYVKFLFYTGCRPEEVVALKWKHIQGNRILIEEAVYMGIRKDTKTHETRFLPVNSQLSQILNECAARLPDQMKQPECLVFPSPKGKVINTNNFLKQVWGAVIKGLVEAGEVSEYLPQYNARHTFITLCLQSHVDIVTLAQWVGNSPEVILQNYAGANSYIQVPEL